MQKTSEHYAEVGGNFIHVSGHTIEHRVHPTSGQELWVIVSPDGSGVVANMDTRKPLAFTTAGGAMRALDKRIDDIQPHTHEGEK